MKWIYLFIAGALWTGMGIVGTTLLGIFLFHEKLSVPQVICVILIVNWNCWIKDISEGLRLLCLER